MGKTPFSRVVVHFMSGTGNSFRVAKWFWDAARERGVDSALVPILRGGRIDETAGGADRLTVVVTPTHGFTSPWEAIWFCLRMPLGRGSRAAVAVTRAGTKFGPVYLPGLDGTAAYLPALILFIKGYRVLGALGLDMPSNWTAAHPGFKKENAEAIIARTRPKAERFIQRMLDGRFFWGSWISFPLGLLLIPVSMGYLLYGRIMLGKLWFASSKCNGCGVCAANCPQKAIKMLGKTPSPYWTVHCESCMRCMAFCPREAVEASHALAIIVCVLLSFLPPQLLAVWVVSRLAPHTALEPVLRFFFQWGLTISAICLIYMLFALSIRVRFVKLLFGYATFTRFFRRYREPEIRLENFRGSGYTNVLGSVSDEA